MEEVAYGVASLLTPIPYLARTVLGAVFLAAAAQKLSAVEVLPVGVSHGPAILAYAMARHAVIPAELTSTLSWAAVGAELALGSWLLTHRAPRAAGGAAALLLAILSVYLVLAGRNGERVECSCFGVLKPAMVRDLLLRNAALGLLGGASAFRATT